MYRLGFNSYRWSVLNRIDIRHIIISADLHQR